MPAPVKNACLYDPKHKGIISSVITAVGHVFNSVFTIVGELMVNRNQVPPNAKGFYDHEIAIRSKYYFILIICSIPVGTILALLLTYQYNPELMKKDNEKANDDLNQKDQNDLPKQPEEKENYDNLKIDLLNNIGFPNEEENETDSQNLPSLPSPLEREKMNQQLCRALKHYRLWFLSLITFLSSFVMFCCLNTFKIVGSLNSIKVSYMTFTATFMGFANVFLNPIWGYYADKVSFKILFNIINVLGIISGITMSLTLSYQISIPFCLIVAINMMCAAGSLTVMHTHIMTVYSVKYVMQLGGVTGLTNGLGNLLGSVFAFIITNFFELKGDEKTKGFFILYGVGSMLSFVAFILTLFESDNEFWGKEDFGHISAIGSGRTSAASNDAPYIKPEEGDSSQIVVAQGDEEKEDTKGENEETQEVKEETKE